MTKKETASYNAQIQQLISQMKKDSQAAKAGVSQHIIVAIDCLRRAQMSINLAEDRLPE